MRRPKRGRKGTDPEYAEDNIYMHVRAFGRTRRKSSNNMELMDRIEDGAAAKCGNKRVASEMYRRWARDMQVRVRPNKGGCERR